MSRGAQRRLALSRLLALERWVHEALAVHPRPYVLRAHLARDIRAVRAAAVGDAALQARIGARLRRLRGRCPRPASAAP